MLPLFEICFVLKGTKLFCLVLGHMQTATTFRVLFLKLWKPNLQRSSISLERKMSWWYLSVYSDPITLWGSNWIFASMLFSEVIGRKTNQILTTYRIMIGCLGYCWWKNSCTLRLTVDSPFQLVQDFFHQPYMYIYLNIYIYLSIYIYININIYIYCIYTYYIYICWLVSTHLKNIKHFHFPQVSECTISFQTNIQETTYYKRENICREV